MSDLAPSSPIPSKRLLLIGWDATDWEIINPLLDAGKMPNLARLIEEGVMGNLATLHPIISPMLWTSIATGKLADKHGIHGFTEVNPTGGARPATSTSRRVKALWNIFQQALGWCCNVAAWWVSYPAEPLDGAYVSNLFCRAHRNEGKWAYLKAGYHQAAHDLLDRAYPPEVPYPSLVTNPSPWAARVSEFPGPDLLPHPERLTGAVRPELHRDRTGNGK